MTLRSAILPLVLGVSTLMGPAHAQDTAPAPAPAPAPVTAASSPAWQSTEQSCRDLWRAYERSEACYGRYRTAHHGLKPEAAERCGPPLKEPASECPRRR